MVLGKGKSARTELNFLCASCSSSLYADPALASNFSSISTADNPSDLVSFCALYVIHPPRALAIRTAAQQNRKFTRNRIPGAATKFIGGFATLQSSTSVASPVGDSDPRPSWSDPPQPPVGVDRLFRPRKDGRLSSKSPILLLQRGNPCLGTLVILLSRATGQTDGPDYFAIHDDGLSTAHGNRTFQLQ